MKNLIDFNLLKEYDSILKNVLGVWQKEKSYSVDDTVQYKGNYLKCTTAGISGTTTLNFTGLDVGDTITDGTVVWEIIEPPSGSGNGLNDWVANTQYKIDSIVVNNGQIYKSLVGFTSGSTFENIEILEDYELQTGDTPILWASGTEIRTNDIVSYDGNYYKALYDFTCGSTFTKYVFEEYVPKSLTQAQIDAIIENFNPEFTGPIAFVVEDSAPAHNAVFRSNDLTDYFNSGQMSEEIANGTFRNIFPGDYIIKSVTVNGTTYNDVKWIVGDLDYHLHSGDTETTAHHVLLFPETVIGTAQMNTSYTSSGGYVGSRMWTTTIPLYVTGITNAFGSAHVLQHREELSTATDTNRSRAYYGLTGASSAWAWKDVKVNLFNEYMIYGSNGSDSSLYDSGDGNTQIAVMRHHKSYIHTRSNEYWLRSVASSEKFARCYLSGTVSNNIAISMSGVRPYFLLT